MTSVTKVLKGYFDELLNNDADQRVLPTRDSVGEGMPLPSVGSVVEDSRVVEDCRAAEAKIASATVAEKSSLDIEGGAANSRRYLCDGANPGLDVADDTVFHTDVASDGVDRLRGQSPKRRRQIMEVPSLLADEQATLEAHKRRRLEKMLSQQVLSAKSFDSQVPLDTFTLETLQRVNNDECSKPASIAEVPSDDNTLKLCCALLQWADNGRPQWAQDRFEALLFEVAGLSLAVPLVALGQIVPIDKKLTVLSGRSDWFMGILPSVIGDIRTVNTALFVMPERYEDTFVDSAKYVVSIDGLTWGLAVDAINQPVTLDADDVQWRTERSKRPWLAGTVKSKMCALIDIPQMANLLEQADQD